MYKKYLLSLTILTLLPVLSACSDTEPVEEERKVLTEEMSSDVILEMINQGKPVEFKNVIIKGDLNSDDLGLPVTSVSTPWLVQTEEVELKVIESRISLVNCVFDGNVFFKYVLFKQEVNLHGACFNKSAGFDGSQFEKALNFESACFNGRAVFAWCRFKSSAIFRRSTWRSASFAWVLADGEISFFDSVFKGRANFAMTRFNNFLEFRGAIVEGEADFGGVILGGDALFFSADFRGKVIPPKKFTGHSLGLFWDSVKHTIPFFFGAVDCYAAWENLFTSAGDFGEARRVHRAWVRHELGLWFLLWFVVFLVVTFYFAARYYRRFGPVPRHSRLQHLRRVLLFSLDVLSPGIGAYKYEWDSILPVKKAVVLTTIESVIGWILLGAFATIGVSWLLA